MTSIVVDLYSSSPSITRAVESALGEQFTVRVVTKPLPKRAAFVISTSGQSTRVYLFAVAHKADTIYLPSAAMHLAAECRYRGGAVLIGADHADLPPKPTQGALW